MTALKAQATPPPGAACADDFYTWTQEQGARLRAGDVARLDPENPAAEIEGSGESRFASSVRASRTVPVHGLTVDHRPSRRTRSRAISIATRRDHAAEDLKQNPGLRSRSDEAVARAFRTARLEASKETRLPPRRFPEACPYTCRDIMDRPFAIDPNT